MRLRLVVAALLFVSVPIKSVQGADEVSFRSQIAPILWENCLACHGPKKAEGGYRVDTFDELRKAGDSGETPVVSNDVATSSLLHRLTTDDESIRMPAESESLAAEQIALVNRWIATGAKFDGDNPAESLLTVIPPLTYAAPPESYPQPLPVTAIAFSPDNSQVITSGYHELLVWSARDGKLVRRIPNVPQSVYSICFLADMNMLAVAGGDPGIRGEVRLIDFATGSLKKVIALSADVILDVAIRPQRQHLVMGGADGMIRIVKSDDFTEVRTIASHADWVTAVAWSDDGTRLASASRDKSVKVYDGDSGELLLSYTGHGMPVRNVLFASDGKTLFSTASDNQLHRWSITDGAKVAGIGVGGDAFQTLRVGESIWLSSSDRNVRLFDSTTNTVTRTMAGHQDWVVALASSPDSMRLASGSMDGEVRIWNVADGTLAGQWLAKP
jgi:WD40 repeat protein